MAASANGILILLAGQLLLLGDEEAIRLAELEIPQPVKDVFQLNPPIAHHLKRLPRLTRPC